MAINLCLNNFIISSLACLVMFALKLLKLVKQFEIDKIKTWLESYKTGEK